MRYRQLSETGDYQFGTAAPFLVNAPAAVAQAIGTRMELMAREWFLDRREGLDLDNILGNGTQGTRDREVQERILGTRGVTGIADYSSTVSGRSFTVAATVDTVYGRVTLQRTF